MTEDKGFFCADCGKRLDRITHVRPQLPTDRGEKTRDPLCPECWGKAWDKCQGKLGSNWPSWNTGWRLSGRWWWPRK